MSSPSIKLQHLRGIFVVYYVLKSLAGAVVAFGVLQPLTFGFYGLRNWTRGSLVMFSMLVTAGVLALALLVFARLLQRKNWARVLLLVLGWLAVIGAFFGLLMSPQLSDPSSWLGRIIAGLDLDWEKLLAFDRVQKVSELLFWGYLISVLQFDPDVKNEFCPASPSDREGEPS